MKIKVLFVIAFCYIFVATSCSLKIKAKNLPKGRPDYIAYNNGDTIFTDGSIKKSIEEIKVNKKEVSEVKEGQSFKVIYDNKIYQGFYYGKLNVFIERGDPIFMGYNTNPINGKSMGPKYQSTHNYYLQKRGENEVYELTSNQLKEMVKDNPLAFRKAKSAIIYHKIIWPSVFLFFGGVIGGIALQNTPIFIAGLVAFPVNFISAIIGNKKMSKAIKIYNR